MTHLSHIPQTQTWGSLGAPGWPGPHTCDKDMISRETTGGDWCSLTSSPETPQHTEAERKAPFLSLSYVEEKVKLRRYAFQSPRRGGGPLCNDIVTRIFKFKKENRTKKGH